MPRVKIKQLDERVATNGLHMGGGPERRKLEPGEVVDISEDFRLPNGDALLELLWQTGKLEMTLDPISRPLDYSDYRQGKLCSPSYKPRDPSDKVEMERARAKVNARLADTESEAISPADDVPDSEPAPVPVRIAAKAPVAQKGARNRRAERRAALQAAKRGESLST